MNLLVMPFKRSALLLGGGGGGKEEEFWYLVVLAVYRRANFRKAVAQRINDGDLGCHVSFDFTLRTPTPAKKKILIAVTNPVKRILDQSAERIAPRLNRSCRFRLA